MGYHLSRLDEPVFKSVSKPLLTEFDIHHRLESCGQEYSQSQLKEAKQSYSLLLMTTLVQISEAPFIPRAAAAELFFSAVIYTENED